MLERTAQILIPNKVPKHYKPKGADRNMAKARTDIKINNLTENEIDLIQKYTSKRCKEISYGYIATKMKILDKVKKNKGLNSEEFEEVLFMMENEEAHEHNPLNKTIIEKLKKNSYWIDK